MSPSVDTGGRPGTANSEAPTLIRQFPKEPRWLDRDNESTGGSEAADWRQKFVKVIAEHTKDMTTLERTEFFEACITRNKDRYIQTFAAYYGQHPEHIPDRPGGAKSTKQEQEGMVETPEVIAKQSSLFKEAWLVHDEDHAAFRSKRTAIEEKIPGPKDESDSCAEPPKCDHCKKDAQKQKWLNPFSSVRKAFSKKPKTNSTVITAPMLQFDGTVSKDSISGTSTSSLKELPAPRRGRLSEIWPPTEHAQHVEQQA